MNKKNVTRFLLTAVLGLTAFSSRTPANAPDTLNGAGVQARFDQDTGEISLYRQQDDGTFLQMSRPSCVSYPVINGEALSDFTNFDCRVEPYTDGAAGSGNRMTVTSHSASANLTRVVKLESIDEVPGLFYISTSYTASGKDVSADRFVDCEFALYEPAQTAWSYNGGGEGPQSYYDTLQKIDFTDNATFHRDNRQDETSVGIPAADIYSENGGIAIGDASATRRSLQTPVEEKEHTAFASIKRPAQTIKAGESLPAGEGFVHVHDGDYYMGLRGYADGMRQIGFETLDKEEIPENSYDLRWESWGWEFDWTLELILGKLDELQALGIKQVTLDDGWYINAGEWDLNAEKLPNGDADMKLLTDAIHAKGMTALLWWRPCDGGREKSSLYKEHPDYFVQNEDGSVGKLAGPGAFNRFNGTTGYALCPGSKEAVQSQVDFVKKALGEWGFDGLKSDYVWSIPKCYNPEHQHERPEESTEQQAVFYRDTYLAMKECSENAFHLLCNCGTPQDYYSLPYVTQIPTADPTSVDQTRRRVKAYKALCGDFFPVTTDHNELWYPSSVGTGAVLIEKRNMNGSQQADYERWLEIAQKTELQKGEFIGDLYSYGFDPYETYVINKDGTMYYGFYRDGQYRPDGNPKIELKGLNPNRLYRIVDYVNDQVIATNVPGSSAEFDYAFSSYLLVYAKELNKPDVQEQEITVEETDSSIVFEGSWTAEQNSAFSGGGCKYTNQANAAAVFAFHGTKIAWYGQKDTNFGTAEVYINDELQEEVRCTGAASSGVKLYEKTNLSNGPHTIKILCKTGVIDIDRFVYGSQSADAASSLASLSQFSSVYQADAFQGGKGWEDFSAAKSRLDDLLAQEDASPESLAQAEEQFFTALFALRKPVHKDFIGSPAPVPEEVEAEKPDASILYRVLLHAETLDMQNVIPAVKSLYQSALDSAIQTFGNPQADQNEMNRAFANLLDKIQYAEYTIGDKTELQSLVASYRKMDLSVYSNSKSFSEELEKAELLLLDENALDYELLEMASTLHGLKNGLTTGDCGTGHPQQVKNVTAKPKKNALLISWDKDPAAVSYTVRIQKDGAWQTAGSTAENTFEIKGLKPAKKYQIEVCAYGEKSVGASSITLYTATQPAKPKVKSVSNYKKTGIKIKCAKNGETGFEVWVKKGKKALKKAASGSKTITLKKGIRNSGKVTVKIRGYVKYKNTKVYGAFSKVKIKK